VTDDFDELGSIDFDDTIIHPDVERLLQVASAPGTSEELSAESSVVSAMLGFIVPRPTNVIPITTQVIAHRPSKSSKSSKSSKRLTRAAIVAAGLLCGAGAAAATGNLPDSAQSAVARATAHIGIHLTNPDQKNKSTPVTRPVPGTSTAGQPVTGPRPKTPGSETPPSTPNAEPNSASNATPGSKSGSASGSASTVPGPDANGPAKAGLCQAWTAQQRTGHVNDRSVAMQNLEAAAKAAQQTVEQFCASTTPNSPAAESTSVPSSERPNPSTPVNSRGNSGGGKNGGGNNGGGGQGGGSQGGGNNASQGSLAPSGDNGRAHG
jgi:uncharacterized membrane protein YgcG